MTYPQEPGYQNIDTSKQAAESVKEKAAALRPLILKAIKDSGGGLSTYGVSATLNINYHQVHPRIAEMHTSGMVYDTGRREKNPLTGRQCAIWNVTEGGLMVKHSKRTTKAKKLSLLLVEALEVIGEQPLLHNSLIVRIKRELNNTATGKDE